MSMNLFTSTTHATKPQRWPNKASAAADTVQVRLHTIGKRAAAIDKAYVSIDTQATLIVDALRNGNVALAAALALDMRAAALTARQLAVDVRSEAQAASDTLARARRGEYEE